MVVMITKVIIISNNNSNINNGDNINIGYRLKKLESNGNKKDEIRVDTEKNINSLETKKKFSSKLLVLFSFYTCKLYKFLFKTLHRPPFR